MIRTAALLTLVFAASPLAAAIHGRVSGDGLPVENAKVSAFPVETFEAAVTRMLAKQKLAPLATATTAADGTFTLAIDGNGSVVVEVESAQFARSVTHEVLGDNDVLIGLTARHRREYTLKSPDGPVAGAHVLVFQGESAIEATTDARGKLTLDDATGATVLAVHPRVAQTPVPILPGRDVINVARGVPLKGKVVDPRGAPVAGARISLGLVASAVSAADGSFTIVAAERSDEPLLADAGELGGMIERPAEAMVIKLAPRVRLSGVVRDAEKRPLRGVALVLGNESELQLGITTVTDDKGAYSAFVAPGRYVIAARGPRWHVDDTIDARKAVTRDLVATPVPVTAGVVRDARNGEIVAGAQVAVAFDATGMETNWLAAIDGQGSFVTTSGPDGRFRIALPGGDLEYVLVGYKRGMPPGQSSIVKLNKSRELTVSMANFTHELSGTVKDASGRAIPGVAVRVAQTGYVVLGAFDDPLLTDASGLFSMPLPYGSWRLAFEKDGYLKKALPAEMQNNPVTLSVALDPAFPIRGRVVRRSGGAVAGAMVADVVLGVQTITEADGSFALTNVSAGEHELYIMLRGGRAVEQRVTAPATDVRIVLDDPGGVRGRVVDEAGAPVPSFVAELTSGDAPPQEASGAGGAFAFDDAPAGEATLTVKAKGFAEASRSVVVEAGKTTGDLVLTLRRGRAVRGKVVSASGEALAGVKIARNQADEIATNADGTYEIAGLGAEESWLTFSAAGYMSESRKLPAGDADTQLDVKLRPGIAITGHVLAPNGQPLAGASVWATTSAPGAGPVTPVKTDAAGAFRLEGLMVARYDVNAGLDASGPANGAAPFAPHGRLRDVDVEHVRDVTVRTTQSVYGTIYGDIVGVDMNGRQVQITATAGEESARGRVTESKYRMELAPVGTVTVQALLGGEGQARASRPVTVDVPPNGEVRVDLRFDDVVPVGGRVLRGGVPVPGANVEFSGLDGSVSMARAGEGGVYHTAVVAGHYNISVDSYLVERDVAGPETIDINIDLATVTVTVLDGDSGLPVSRASVSGRDSTSSTHAAVMATTGSSGQAVLEIPRSVSDIVVEKEGYASAAVAADAPSLVVKLARSEGAVVRIVDARDGRPLTGYAIARDGAGRVVAARNEAAPDGSMRFPLPPGRYRFSASSEAYGSHTVAADVPGPDVQIPLPRGGKLLLTSHAPLLADARLLGPGGEEYVRCYCNGLAEIRINGRTTLVDSIAPGIYTLELRQASAKPRTIPVSVIAEETTTVPLD